MDTHLLQPGGAVCGVAPRYDLRPDSGGGRARVRAGSPDRLPLAQSVLLLWQQIADPAVLQSLFDAHRGRAYDKALSFPPLVQLLADALLQHDGSAAPALSGPSTTTRCPSRIPAAYGKLRRLPIAVSTAFLTEGTARLQELLPGQNQRPRSHAACAAFTVTVLDGKTIKHVAKRLKLLRGVRRGVWGGKTLVALELNSGLAVAMAAHPDGECNELRLLPEVVGRAATRVVLARGCGWAIGCTATWSRRAAFLRAATISLLRYQSKVHFHPDPSTRCPARHRCGGRPYTEEWGWLGAATDATASLCPPHHPDAAQRRGFAAW